METPPLNTEVNLVIERTRQWVETVVVGENFCPFARREMVNNRIRYRMVPDAGMETALVMMVEELRYLEAHAEIETTLLICPEGFSAFPDFLDLCELAEAQLESSGYEGIYQVASFHPDYCFAGASERDAANYTNRSPYPMLHLLREDSIERVLENIENPEDIPDRNIRHARELGLEVMQQKLADCFTRSATTLSTTLSNRSSTIASIPTAPARQDDGEVEKQ